MAPLDDSGEAVSGSSNDYDEEEEYEDEEEDLNEDSVSSESVNHPKDLAEKKKLLLNTVTPYPSVYRKLAAAFGRTHATKYTFSVLRSKTIIESDSVLRESETDSDCRSDRAAALDEQKVLSLELHRLADSEQSDFLSERLRGHLRPRVHRRRPLPASAVLPVGGLLLVRERGHGQEHPGHLGEGRAPRLHVQHFPADEGLPGAEEAGVPLGPEGIPARADSQQRERGVRGA